LEKRHYTYKGKDKQGTRSNGVQKRKVG